MHLVIVDTAADMRRSLTPTSCREKFPMPKQRCRINKRIYLFFKRVDQDIVPTCTNLPE